MRKLMTLAAVLGGVSLTSAAMAQDIASLPTRNGSYLVFLDRDGLSPVAKEMVRNAAHAAGPGQPISLSGQAPYVEAVKAQLVREGIPAAQIRVSAWKRSFLPSPGDGLANPEARSVQIDF
jgi:hypothetical protein